MAEYAYCEPETAPPFGTLHIRPLTAKGRKTGGGIDTPPLCGRDWPGGWDLDRPVVLAEAIEDARRINPSGRYDTCPKCVAILSIAEEG